MNRTKIYLPLLAIFVLAISLFTACKKDVSPADTSNSKNLSIYLTDDPCIYDSVFVDIAFVEVKIDTSQDMDDDHHGDDDHDGDDDHQHHDDYGVWDTLSITPGVYNIAALRNGVNTLLASGTLPAGTIRKIRITLGTNNSVVIAGVSHPLLLLPGTNNYVYVKIHGEHQDVSGTNTAIWLDFNICSSIIHVNGQYYLKPFIKPFGMQHFGKIEGRVFPEAAHTMITARNATDSGTAIAEHDGEYKIMGLHDGTYTLTFDGMAPYVDTTINNIQVQNGHETQVPDVTLRQ